MWSMSRGLSRLRCMRLMHTRLAQQQRERHSISASPSRAPSAVRDYDVISLDSSAERIDLARSAELPPFADTVASTIEDLCAPIWRWVAKDGRTPEELQGCRRALNQLLENIDARLCEDISVKRIVDKALCGQQAQTAPDEVVCTCFGAELTRRHFECLLPDMWLNDEVVNSYLRLVQERADGRCWCPNSFFWPKLSAEGYSAVRRWMRRAAVNVDLLQAILVPLHLNATHWALAVIDFRALGIHYFDSLAHAPPRNLVARLEEYLQQENFMDKWPILSRDISPLQRNGSDCGVFACACAERFAAGGLENVQFDTSQFAITQMRRKIATAICMGSL